MTQIQNNSQNFNKRLWHIIPFVFLIIILVGCHFPAGSQPSQTQRLHQDNELNTHYVDLQLSLVLDQPISSDEKIAVEIVDVLTGLTRDNRLLELREIDIDEYTVSISVPFGSVLRYRYIKIGSNISPEAKPDGRSVDYRLLYVNGPNTIIDRLQGWHGEEANQNTGRFIGTIINQETSQPIPDILVSAGGQLTFTDANGKFKLDRLSPGVHNAVFYAIDGRYQTMQQGALIAEYAITPAEVELTPQQTVQVTFNVSTPGDALGAPVYIAGNLYQFGNTFANLPGSMQIKPKRQPVLNVVDDQTQSITLTLFSGSDLNYKFTLGDGYWNGELNQDGNPRSRQLIVPDQDITLNLTIERWRRPGVEPITFLVSTQPETTPQDTKYIQFKTEEWTEPIPLWPVGINNYLYILFSPLETSSPVHYRFCRNENCTLATNFSAEEGGAYIEPLNQEQFIEIELNQWANWQAFPGQTTGLDAYIPDKPEGYRKIIELSPEMDPSWLLYAPSGYLTASELNANTIIFSPRWVISTGSPILSPETGLTPFYSEFLTMMKSAQMAGINLGIFPQVDISSKIEDFWLSSPTSGDWWEDWFDSYRQFLLNYANIAEIGEAESLYLGGKFVVPAYSGGIFPDGSTSNVPDEIDEEWIQLIADIRDRFQGKLVWVVHANQELDPLPGFIEEFDEIYISIDSPLTTSESSNPDSISAGFISVIDRYIYEVYRSTQKPITLALGYPSVKEGSKGCALIHDACYNDGLFLPDQVGAFSVDYEEQVMVYNAILPTIASRDWITGLAIRGFQPAVILHDGSSSIAGKPAADVIEYWFSGLSQNE